MEIHPVYILRTLTSAEKFHDRDIKKIIRYLAINSHKIETRHTGHDVGYILNFLKQTELVSGHILELGTWKGGFTILMAKYLEMIKSSRKIITCDSFAGMPKNITVGTTKHTEGILKADYEDVIKKFHKFNVDYRISTIRGYVEESLKSIEHEIFSFAWLDLGGYDSMKFGLEFVYPRLSKNGILAIDDYPKMVFGTKKAVDDFCHNNKLELILDPYPHLIKNN